MGKYWKWDIKLNQNIENMLKAMTFYHLQEDLEPKYGKKLMDTATKTGIDAAKTVDQKQPKLQEI